MPTKNITAKTTCEVLMKFFCQTRFPKPICTDQGTSFTAQLTHAIQDVLGVSPRFYVSGHPERCPYREIPHTLTGVSPYQLVYGKLLSETITILKEFWAGEREITTSSARSVEEYLKQFQKKLQDAHEIASENSAKSQEHITSHYNLRSREKSFSVGDEVLILMLSSPHKLLNTWIGPAKVVELTKPHSCLVQMEAAVLENYM
ncbi:retrovirus-related Pol polyprotein from transposon opus [Trichonephila clavata]|uniref:Retrovirus-related Pol polyprotein from transposon opus n=1 Tax=Trichonephila clavata TaxID=2740835 RepID=A0A8X6F116_TRICU|nr:retrovirus-related Pol polyprotein from transposon opus [Trichonephila clavata]